MSALFDVLLPAAGSGTRFGGDKLLVELGGVSVLRRSVALFSGREDVGRIVIVTAPDRMDAYGEHLKGHSGRKEIAFVKGGRERWESVLLGLRALVAGAAPGRFVAIHDAARPLTPQGVIDAAFQGARKCGGGVPVIAEPATLKRLGPPGEGIAGLADQSGILGLVANTVSRQMLYQAQTPQCFGLAELLRSYESLLAGGELQGVTDDAQVFEKNALPVAMTRGSALNLKITTPEDMALAQALLGVQ